MIEILRCSPPAREAENYFRYFQLSQQCCDLIETGTLARARYFHLLSRSRDYEFSCRRVSVIIRLPLHSPPLLRAFFCEE